MADGKRILVAGATGQQGGATARELLAKGYAVRAMTRNPGSEKAAALGKLGAEVVKGDLDDRSSLEGAVKDMWGVFAVQNTWEAGVEGEEKQGKLMAEVAKNAGVQHFVYASVGSADKKTGIPHFDNKWRVEEKIRALGFPSFTFVRPVFFMDNFVTPWFKPHIDQGNLAIGVKPDTVMQMIACDDVGKYHAWAFENHEALNGAAIDIAGDAMTMPEAAKVLSSASGKQIGFFQVPIEEVRKFSEDFALMLEWFDRVGYSVDIQGEAKKSGIKPTSFADWAKTARW
jgi:uncharacterized protein YbjT (DUF2867 family)